MKQNSQALDEQKPDKITSKDTEPITIVGLVNLNHSPRKVPNLDNIHRDIVESEPVYRQSALALTEEIGNINKVLMRSSWGGNPGRMSAIGRNRVNG